jgi:hypothetical protein
MASATANLALAASLPVFLVGEALAQAPRVRLPSPVEVGQGLALANGCVDRDGFTLCDPAQPVGATFRQVLCVEYGSDLEHRPIARCVYTGARMEYQGGRRPMTRDFGDGAIDLIYIGNTWLPNNRD